MSLAQSQGMRLGRSELGISLVETLGSVGIMAIVAAIAVPATVRTVGGLRLDGDARNIHNAVGLAKMRAAAKFSRERIFVDLTTNSYLLQSWDKTTGSWTADGGSTRLATGVRFGFGTLTAPPANTQGIIGQAPACRNDANTVIANTACVVFNSRGIPIDSNGDPNGAGAFYLTDGVGVYAITLSATPLVRLWWSPAKATSWAQK